MLTEGARYTEDVAIVDPRLAGACHVVFVRSPVAHARVRSVDVSAAAAAPGVIAALGPADVDLDPIPPGFGMLNEHMAMPWLAGQRVRYVGEPLAIVVATDRAAATDAAELVDVDLEPLPAVVDPADAERGEVLLFEEAGTNVAFDMPAREDRRVDFDGCEVTVTATFDNQRVAPCPLEGRSTAAVVADDGRLTVWLSTQGVHPARQAIASMLGLDPSRVHAICPDVGGGFGAKGSVYPEDALVCWLALRLGRPVRWTEDRSESMVGLGHGRGQRQTVTIGGTRDGRVTTYRLHVLQDAGAYPKIGALMPFSTRRMLTGTYDIGAVEFAARAVVTNTTPTVAYRGAGRPEAAYAIERAMDLFAAEIGMDPAEVRRRNLVGPDRFPYTTAIGTTYDSGDYPGALDRALEAAGYAALRAEQARRRASGDRIQLGVGVACYVEVTAGFAGHEHGHIEVRPDGSLLAYSGTNPYGQGHATTWAMIISEVTGVPPDRIEVRFGDTDVFEDGTVTGGSRSVQVGGVAMQRTATALVEAARRAAADLLEADPDDIVVDTSRGVFHVAGTPAVSVGWADLGRRHADEPLYARVTFEAEGATYPFGAHVAAVEVDTETGAARLVRLVGVDDAGTIVNRLLAEGQVHGGMAQGIAQAMFEEVAYDPDGNPLTRTFADYAFPSAAELPPLTRVEMETPTPLNPLGAKGIGESGTIGATPAVHNAVIDAVAHLGVRHIPMPTTPERIWRAIREATGG